MSKMRLKKMSMMRLKKPSYMRLRRGNGPSMMRLKKSSSENNINELPGFDEDEGEEAEEEEEEEEECVWVNGVCVEAEEVSASSLFELKIIIFRQTVKITFLAKSPLNPSTCNY
jgi:hypothetical protein